MKTKSLLLISALHGALVLFGRGLRWLTRHSPHRPSEFSDRLLVAKNPGFLYETTT